MKYINRTIIEGKVLSADLIDGYTVTPIDLAANNIVTVEDLKKYEAIRCQPTAEEAEADAIEKAIEKKKAKIDFGVSMIEYYDGFMDSKGFEAQPRTARKAIKAILKPIYNELADGSLRDAIGEIKALTNASFDGVFIRKSAVLKLKNKIEDFLGLPLTQAWNE
jgi:hypothetical protein